MSAIAGFCCFQADFLEDAPRWGQVLSGMRGQMRRRGPGAAGEYLDRHAGLTHAGQDAQSAAQPMTRSSYTVVCDGEIFNADALRPPLEEAGLRFETGDAAEVILNAFLHYGPGFAAKLCGTFACAVWDGEGLYLYRDPIGAKPLFYTVQDGALAFGSQLGAVFAYPGVAPAIDLDALREVFGLGPAHTPGSGVFRGMREVLPGHYARFAGDGLKTVRYWSLESRPHEDSYEDTVQAVAALVTDAVRRQTPADDSVCSLLSGGVDSSIVTAVASGTLAETGRVLDTFSFDFKGNDTFFTANAFQPERDRPFVDQMLAQYSLHHTYLECGEEALADLLYASTDAKELPGMADIDTSLLYFCSLVGRRSRVALTGEGADEVFGGYPWYYREDLMAPGAFPWSRDLEARKTLLSPDFLDALRLDEYVENRYAEALREVPRLPGEDPVEARRREIAYLTLQWFTQTLLVRMDRASAYAGLDARVPFGERRVVEYAWNIPWHMKCSGGVVKGLLREAFRGLLPPEVLRRKKSPYPKTYSPAYTRLLKDRLLELLGDASSPLLPLLDKEKARGCIESPQALDKPWYGQLMAGPQRMAYFLQVEYWLRKYGGLHAC